ncbi:unnamed protein product [Gadus morhua 'NCC']
MWLRSCTESPSLRWWGRREEQRAQGAITTTEDAERPPGDVPCCGCHHQRRMLTGRPRPPASPQLIACHRWGKGKVEAEVVVVVAEQPYITAFTRPSAAAL